MSESQDLLTAGQIIQLERDSYHVISKIGAGGYGSVWKVERQSDGEAFALKTINPYQSHNNNASWRSLGEINNLIDYTVKEVEFLDRLGRKASEHYIIAMLDKGTWQHEELPDQDLPIFTMPIYGGGDLSRYCKAYPKSKPYDANLFLRWAEQLAKALAYLHDQYHNGSPCVHRDIKPANVLLNDEQNAGLTDFGIARLSSGTGTSTSAYSRHFCAPEQILAIYKTTQGHSRYLITPAVDIYSFGILLHELLVGSTEAQEKLGASTEVESHNKHLLLTDAGQFEKVGQLGSIGGLNEQEEQHLLSVVERLFNPVDQDATLIGGGFQQTALPSAKRLAERYIAIQQHMLSPWVHDRPSAKQLIEDFQSLRNAFQPELTHLSMHAVQASHALGAPIELKVSFQGHGLTNPVDWLRFEVDHRLQGDVSLQSNESTWLYESDKVHTVTVVLPTLESAGEHSIDVFAQVGEQTHHATVALTLLLSADKLWEQKQYLPALQQELRPEWLEERLQAVSSIDDVLAFNGLLTNLKQTHGEHDLLLSYEEKLRQHSLAKSSAPAPTTVNPVEDIPTQEVAEEKETLIATKPVYEIKSPQPETQERKKRPWLALLLIVPVVGTATVWGLQQWAKPRPEPTPIQPIIEEPEEVPKDDFEDIPELSIDEMLIPATVFVRGGSFNMGCVSVRDGANGLRCQADEKPPTKQQVRAFDITSHEITVGQYRNFVQDTNRPDPDGCWSVSKGKGWKKVAGYNWNNTGFPQTDDSPVGCINLQDAMDYVAWLSRKTGQKWRLPTEIEWEYAARSGGNSPFYWGDNLQSTCQYGNGTDQSARSQFRWRSNNCNDGYVFSAPVGSFTPNTWDLYDMTGNVWEWTTSCHDKNNCATKRDRVLKGGSWSSYHQLLRSATRFGREPEKRSVDFGFRAVRE